MTQLQTVSARSLLSHCRIVPVIVLSDAAQAIPLGRALLAGGITVAEITLRTSAGLEAIRLMSTLPEMKVGAGSVLTEDQVDEVVAAGAQFVVSPGISAAVVNRARTLGVPALPGIATATDLMLAVSLGLTEVKIFPAGLLGGPAAIRALAAPFTEMSFMPSGGVNPDNMLDYLAVPSVPAVSGSWMVDPKLLAQQRWEDVTALSAAAVQLAKP